MKKGKRSGDEAVKIRSNLLSVVSHELNTPISAILNATVALSEKVPADDEYLQMIRRNAERLQRTVRNLMEISRVDAGALRVRLTELDLANFLRIQLERLRPRLQGFRVELEIEDDLPHVCGDLVRLSHVIDAIVLNAAKFSDRPPPDQEAAIQVELRLVPVADLPPEFSEPAWGKKTGMYLVVSVQSQLPPVGESPSHFEELFEPFTPWRDALTREREGLGVELALAKEILHAHEGFIWADMATQGKGWKFHVALPMLSRGDELNMVLANRLFTAVGALSRVSLLILRPEPGSFSKERPPSHVVKAIQKLLFRSSDSIFFIEETGEITVLMDDCDAASAARVAERIVESLGQNLPGFSFVWASVTGPDEGSTAEELLERARGAWRPGR
ncbi:MAG: hypothetical protein HUU37_08220 [Bdellovibrionales bacterium]|nr:hypothetical protein [Bdellovibrionales bacterium]